MAIYTVSHNLRAMNTARMLGISTKNKAKSTEKLSSGYRINRAADDAAGLAISEKMRSQIRGLTKASENIKDDISYIQTAEGALNEVHSMLSRMYELSVQASNGTETDMDRECLDNEIQEIKEELDRIFADTEFNTRKIWGVEMTPISTTTTTVTDVEYFPAVVFETFSTESTINNVNKGAVPQSSITITTTDDGFKFSWKGYDGKNYESKEIVWGDDPTGTHTVNLDENMDYTLYPDAKGINFSYKYTVNELSTIDDIKTAFNSSQATFYRSISVPVTTVVTRNNSSPNAPSFYASINYDAQLASGRDFNNKDTSFIESTGLVNPARTDDPDSTDFSFSFVMPGIGTVVATPRLSLTRYNGYVVDYNNLSNRTGEGIWWEEAGSSNSRYKSYKYYNISPDFDGIIEAITNTSGHSLYTDNNGNSGTISLYFDLSSTSPYTKIGGGTSSSVGSLTMSININPQDAVSKEAMVDRIRTAVTSITDVDIEADPTKNKPYIDIYRSSSRNSTNLVSTSSEHTETTTEYKDIGKRIVTIQAGANKGQIINIEYDNLNTELLNLTNVNLLTQTSSMEALEIIKEAINIVSKERSVLGAYQNRLEKSQSIDDQAAENLQAAESLIRDTDIAEMICLNSKYTVLEEFGQAMLAQANSDASQVLNLINGR